MKKILLSTILGVISIGTVTKSVNAKPVRYVRTYPLKGPEVIGFYDNGKAVGEWKYYWRNGKTENITNYVDGLADGKMTVYYESGNLKQEGYHKQGKIDGTLIIYYDRPFKVEKVIMNYISGEAISAKSYFSYVDNNDDGKNDDLEDRVESEQYYVDGKLSGTCKEFYKSGKLKQIYEHIHGEPNAKETDFYESGKVQKTTVYKGDKIVSLDTFDTNGNLTCHKVWEKGIIVEQECKE